jgi:hypothetical protein
MLRAELQNLDQSPPALRKFGQLVGIVLLVVALPGLLRSRAWWPWVATPGLLLLGLGSAAPRTLRWIHLGWMALALVLGTVMGAVMLTLVFVLAVTPIGWLTRFRGKDFLRQKTTAPEVSFWIPRDRDSRASRTDYERQF